MTFADGTYAGAVAPTPIVQLALSTSAPGDAQPTAVAATLTGFSFVAGVIPVATKVYTFNYAMIA